MNSYEKNDVISSFILHLWKNKSCISICGFYQMLGCYLRPFLGWILELVLFKTLHPFPGSHESIHVTG